MEQATFLKINSADSVVVCLAPKKKGDIISVDGKNIVVNQDTPAGHKVLIKDVVEGEDIIKYGYPIGHARQSMKAGDWVNENNLKTNLSGTLEYTYRPVSEKLSIKDEKRTFKGYVRKNGDVGVRNEIWIVPTVGCVNGIAERLATQLRQETGEEGIDAIWTWHHNFGCSQLSEDHENTRKVLRDICLHPNAGGVLVLSLGCENNQVGRLRQGPYQAACHPACRGRRDGSRYGDSSRPLRSGQARQTRGCQRQQTAYRVEVWWLRRLLGHHGQPIGWRVLRLARSSGRHQRTDRGSRDVWCRDHSDESL